LAGMPRRVSLPVKTKGGRIVFLMGNELPRMLF
jgi:hypothetical protein